MQKVWSVLTEATNATKPASHTAIDGVEKGLFPHEKKNGHCDCSRWARGEFTVSSLWAQGDQKVTASRDWAVTWAVIELWPSRD